MTGFYLRNLSLITFKNIGKQATNTRQILIKN